MKRVLVPLAIKKIIPETIAPLHFVRESYLKKLTKYNLAPILVPAESTRDVWDALYEESDGLFLTGGLDVDPSHYDADPHPESKPIPDRDEMELYLTKKALEEKKPIFGICRGHQVLAVAGGGTLHQHIPENYPEEVHGRSEGEDGNYETIPDATHPVYIKKESRLYDIIGIEEGVSTTGHHQAINTLGLEFAVSAVSPQGVVEAIEHTDPDYFCFGVQSHPELQGDGPFEKLFREFAEVL